MTPTIVHVVSVSGGKDSTVTAVLARDFSRRTDEPVHYVFADTGNEHEMTYDYIRNYLPGVLGVTVQEVKTDFTDWMAHRRAYVAEHWPLDGVPQGVIDRAVAVLQPSGNPYLDLCLIKGRFPSRTAQFCTQFLKTEPLVEYQDKFITDGQEVMSWQGVRGEESPRRALLPDIERRTGGLWAYRPILNWKVDEVIAFTKKHGVELNPLYRLGMSRVGCMPCINAAKGEIREIANRFPGQIDRIAEWERIVAEAAKRGGASFFVAYDDARGDWRGRNVREVVRWSKTQRGGRKMDFFAEESAVCASSYGLCE